MNKEGFISEISNCSYRENVLYMWIQIVLNGGNVVDFFKENDIHRVVVYGYGRIGKILCDEIKKNDSVELTAIIDKNYKAIDCDGSVISPDDEIPEHDMLVSTYTDTNYVRNKLGGRSSNIVGIDELLMGFSV